MLFRKIAAAALFAITATAANAETAKPASVEVAFGDLNLSHAADAQVLAGRLQAAAKSVCLTANPDLKPEEMQQCMDAAISMAMAQIEGRLDRAVRAHLTSLSMATENP